MADMKHVIAMDRSMTGSLITPAAWVTFDHTVGRHLVKLDDLHQLVSAEMLRPPLALVPDLLDQAMGVLSGSPRATERFRQMLNSLGGATAPTAPTLHVLREFAPAPALQQRRGCLGWLWPARWFGRRAKPQRFLWPPTHSQNFRASGDQLHQQSALELMSFERLEPVLAAAIHAAWDINEMAAFAGSIELGLRGTEELGLLYSTALHITDPAEIRGALNTAFIALGFQDPPGVRTFSLWQSEPAPGPVGPEMGAGFPLPRREGGVGWPGGFGGFPWPFPSPSGGGRNQWPEFRWDSIPLSPWYPCFRDLIHRHLQLAEYRIERIVPAETCPGNVVTIHGDNFAGVESIIFVHHERSHEDIYVHPSSATNSSITVEVPLQAGSGPVGLYIPVTYSGCSRTWTVARPGTPGHITIQWPSIRSFGLLGRLDDEHCVVQGSTARVGWSVAPEDAHVRLLDIDEEGSVTEHTAFAGAINSHTIDTTTEGTRRYRLEVENPCSPDEPVARELEIEVRPHAAPAIEIVAVEVTQGIQVFNLDDPDDSTNNSVELIANMDTVLRVFVRSVSPPPAPLARVSGVLRTGYYVDQPRNTTQFIEAQREAHDRTMRDHSLNFLIPAADATGSRRYVTVQVFTDSPDYCRQTVLTWTTLLNFADRPPLPVTIVRMRDPSERADGTTLITEAFALEQVLRAFRMIPSPRTHIALHPDVFEIPDGLLETDYCERPEARLHLANMLAYLHDDIEDSTHRSSWVGIYSRPCGGVMAWPRTSTCVSSSRADTIAHELMHTLEKNGVGNYQCQLGHTLSGFNDFCEDACQPVKCHRLPGRPTARLNQVPFNIDNMQPVTGALFDLQSYRAPRWLDHLHWDLARELMDDRY